jgi:RimJ/RimL family protein N-acetyltransferase
MTFPDSFATARLRAERLTADHLAELYRMDSDPGFMALLGGVRNAVETAAYLDRNLKHWADHGFGLWMLRDRDEGRFVGRAVLRHLLVEGTDEVEVGYGFYPDCWGRGLATEIASACLQFARSELLLPSVVAITLPANVRSQRVMIKVGLVYERDITHEGLRHVLYRSQPTGGTDGQA